MIDSVEAAGRTSARATMATEKPEFKKLVNITRWHRCVKDPSVYAIDGLRSPRQAGESMHLGAKAQLSGRDRWGFAQRNMQKSDDAKEIPFWPERRSEGFSGSRDMVWRFFEEPTESKSSFYINM